MSDEMRNLIAKLLEAIAQQNAVTAEILRKCSVPEEVLNELATSSTAIGAGGTGLTVEIVTEDSVDTENTFDNTVSDNGEETQPAEIGGGSSETDDEATTETDEDTDNTVATTQPELTANEMIDMVFELVKFTSQRYKNGINVQLREFLKKQNLTMNDGKVEVDFIEPSLGLAVEDEIRELMSRKGTSDIRFALVALARLITEFPNINPKILATFVNRLFDIKATSLSQLRNRLRNDNRCQNLLAIFPYDEKMAKKQSAQLAGKPISSLGKGESSEEQAPAEVDEPKLETEAEIEETEPETNDTEPETENDDAEKSEETTEETDETAEKLTEKPAEQESQGIPTTTEGSPDSEPSNENDSGADRLKKKVERLNGKRMNASYQECVEAKKIFCEILKHERKANGTETLHNIMKQSYFNGKCQNNKKIKQVIEAMVDVIIVWRSVASENEELKPNSQTVVANFAMTHEVANTVLEYFDATS